MAIEIEIEIGDVVVLKGQQHGPKMVVDSILLNGRVICVFYNEAKELVYKNLNIKSVTKEEGST